MRSLCHPHVLIFQAPIEAFFFFFPLQVVIIGWHAVTYILPSPQLPNPIALDLDYVFVDRHPPLRPVSALSVADITFEVPYEFATPAQQEKRWVESWFREKLRTNLGFAEGVRKGLYGVETVAV